MSRLSIGNVVAYLQGSVRYYLYYSSFQFLIPLYVREQIVYRINSMRRECYVEGACVECGCRTTALQMADKSCDGACYPSMFTRAEWCMFKKYKAGVKDGCLWKLRCHKFIKVG